MITPPRTAVAAHRVTARGRPVLIKAISNAQNIHLRPARFCATLRFRRPRADAPLPGRFCFLRFDSLTSIGFFISIR